LDGDNQLKDAELLLKGLGFDQNEIKKPYSSFSGGWKMRVELAKLLIQKPGVVLLDEPTNHLDIKSKEVLKRALLNFGGTLLVVSHDRDFLQGLTDQVFEFRDHKVKPYLGDIDFYLEQRKVNDFREVEKATVKSQMSDTKSPENPSNEISYADQKKLKTLSNKLGSIEKRITELEEAIAAKDQELLERYEELVKTSGYMDRYQELKAELEAKMEEWGVISDQIDPLMPKINV